MSAREELTADLVERARYLARREATERAAPLESEYAAKGLGNSSALLQAVLREDLISLDRVVTTRLEAEFEIPDSGSVGDAAWSAALEAEVQQLIEGELQWAFARAKERTALIGLQGAVGCLETQIGEVRRDRVAFFLREIRINRNRRRTLVATGWPAPEDRPNDDESAEVVEFAFKRRRFDSDINRVCELARERQCFLSFLMIDLDKFKLVNDRLGHSAGDSALRDVAGILLRGTTGKGRLYRLGGDEFGVLLWNASPGEAVALAQRFVSEVEHARIGDSDSPVTLSVGVSTFPMSAASPGDLFGNSDKAMYKAKRGGGNRALDFGAPELGAIAGPVQATASQKPTPQISNAYNLSEIALSVGKWLLENDSTGLGYEFRSLAEMPPIRDAPQQSVEDAALELEQYGLAEVANHGGLEAGARHRLPFALSGLIDYDPDADVLTIASALENVSGIDGPGLLAATGLPITRVNRAILHMKDSGLADVVQTIGTAPFAFYEVRPNFRTRLMSKNKPHR